MRDIIGGRGPDGKWDAAGRRTREAEGRRVTRTTSSSFSDASTVRRGGCAAHGQVARATFFHPCDPGHPRLSVVFVVFVRFVFSFPPSAR
jgi:hypothetical protein